MTIRTLVIDDDYRVAAIHAASVDRVPGFSCVGKAHTAREARACVANVQPDLLLLDVYLPDDDGLALLRDLHATPAPPGCIVITASRDLDTVRAATHLGAAYYLVKPFGFAQLREQLEAYRQWRDRASGTGEVDQATVDSLYSILRGSAATPNSAALPPTMRNVLHTIQDAGRPLAAGALAAALGISRPTAQRHLSELHRRGFLNLELEYGSAGRPAHRYTVPGRP
ncbi:MULTISPECIES: response regulator [unclassified Amycolatopsis]|uniref:response regulator n=1 Tax=unclassified Amycolatopsis TaxID=2618356 RepID=UPI0023AFEC94|nr:response regulator [Amycolatopsis sp. La24]